MTIGRNLRITIAGAAASLAIVPAAQATCWKPRERPQPPSTDVCKSAASVDVDDLLARYGTRLTASQKQLVIAAAQRLLDAKCGAPADPDDNSGPGNNNGGGNGQGPNGDNG